MWPAFALERMFWDLFVSDSEIKTQSSLLQLEYLALYQVVYFYGMSIIGWNPVSSCLTTSSPVLKAQRWMLPDNLRGQKIREGFLFETLASRDFISTSSNRNFWVLPPAFPLRARGIPICYWLHICVPLKFLGWSSNLQCSIIWRWGLWEVIR